MRPTHTKIHTSEGIAKIYFCISDFVNNFFYPYHSIILGVFWDSHPRQDNKQISLIYLDCGIKLKALRYCTVTSETDKVIKQMQQIDGPIRKCLTVPVLPLIGCHPRKSLCQPLTGTFKLYSPLELLCVL